MAPLLSVFPGIRSEDPDGPSGGLQGLGIQPVSVQYQLSVNEYFLDAEGTFLIRHRPADLLFVEYGEVRKIPFLQVAPLRQHEPVRDGAGAVIDVGVCEASHAITIYFNRYLLKHIS